MRAYDTRYWDDDCLDCTGNDLRWPDHHPNGLRMAEVVGAQVGSLRLNLFLDRLLEALQRLETRIFRVPLREFIEPGRAQVVLTSERFAGQPSIFQHLVKRFSNNM